MVRERPENLASFCMTLGQGYHAPANQSAHSHVAGAGNCMQDAAKVVRERTHLKVLGCAAANSISPAAQQNTAITYKDTPQKAYSNRDEGEVGVLHTVAVRLAANLSPLLH